MRWWGKAPSVPGHERQFPRSSRPWCQRPWAAEPETSVFPLLLPSLPQKNLRSEDGILPVSLSVCRNDISRPGYRLTFTAAICFSPLTQLSPSGCCCWMQGPDLSFPGGWCEWVISHDGPFNTRPAYNLHRQYVFRGMSWKITQTFGLSFRDFGEDGKVHFQGQGKTLVKQRL